MLEISEWTGVADLAQPGSDKTVYTIKKNAQAELIEKKSRFIAYAVKTSTEEQALSELATIKALYPDATHHTYAYIINNDNTFYQRYSDDKEPSGTAGLTILSILQKNNLENVLIVVVRYFGGTLLGTGGLARAYKASAKAAVLQAGLAKRVYCVVLKLTVDYSEFEKIKNILNQHQILDICYEEQVIVRFALPYLKEEQEVGRINELVKNKFEIVREKNIFMEI